MGKSVGGLIGGLAFGVLGGFVGGLFTAGAFSATAAAVGFSVGGALYGPKPQFGTGGGNAPTVEDSSYDYPLAEFAGKVGNVRGNVITVARNSTGEYAGVLVVTDTEEVGGCGSGQEVEEESYFLIGAYALGRAMAGPLDDPEPLFVDKIEIEDSGGRRVIYDRNGETEKARGYELTQTISSVTGRVICETSDELRLYTGTNEQNPDSALTEFYPDGLPAYRGTAYVVFNRLKVQSQPAIYFTVRSETTGRRELIAQRLENVGIPAERLDLTAIDEEAVVIGKQIVGTTSAREVCEKLARPVFCNFAFDGQRVKAVSLVSPYISAELNPNHIGAWSGSSIDNDGNDRSGRLQLQERDQTEMCSVATVAFTDRNQKYEANTGKALQTRATHSNSLDFDLAEVSNLGTATRLSRAIRDEDWLRDKTGVFNLLPGHEDLMPGDVVPVPLGSQTGLTLGETGADLGTLDLLILEMSRLPNGSLEITNAVPYASHPYTQTGAITGPGQPDARVMVFDEPILVVVDSSPLSARKPDTISAPGVLAIVSQSGTKKWKGASVRAGVLGDGNRFDSVNTKQRGTVGTLAADYAPLVDAEIQVEVQYGALYSITTEEAAKGWNLLAFESGLYVSFATATATDYDPETDVTSYTLSGLQTARYGTDYEEAGYGEGLSLAAGTRFGQVRDRTGAAAPGLVWLDVPGAQRGKEILVRALSLGPRQEPTTIRPITYQARNMEEYAPTVEAAYTLAGDFYLSGRGRTRYIASNTMTSTSDVQLSAKRYNQGFKYQVRFDLGGGNFANWDLFTLDENGSFDFTVSAAQLSSIYSGSVPGTITGDIAAYSDIGPGRRRQFTSEATES